MAEIGTISSDEHSEENPHPSQGILLRDTPKLESVRFLASTKQHTSSHEIAKFELSDSLDGSDYDTSVINNVLTYKSTRFPSRLEYSSEDDVKHHVRCMLQEVIGALGKENDIFIFGEASVAKLRPDLWLVKRNDYHGTPIGILEVKKPSQPSKTSHLKNENVYGQIFDYLKMLKVYFNLDFALGLLSTFNEWRACWLPEDDKMISLANTDTTRVSSTGERKIRGTNVYKLHDEQCIKMISKAILKMSMSRPTNSTPLIAEEREYLVLDKNSWSWSMSPWNNGDQLQNEMPRKDCTTFYMLEQLGNDRVWLACSKMRYPCVLKFNEDNDKESAEQEARIWDAIGFKKARAVTLLKNQHAIVMPYLLPCNKMRDNPPSGTLANNAINELSKLCKYHTDIKIENLGYCATTKKIFFFNLSKTSNAHSAKAAMSIMKRQFKEKVPLDANGNIRLD